MLLLPKTPAEVANRDRVLSVELQSFMVYGCMHASVHLNRLMFDLGTGTSLAIVSLTVLAVVWFHHLRPQNGQPKRRACQRGRILARVQCVLHTHLATLGGFRCDQV